MRRINRRQFGAGIIAGSAAPPAGAQTAAPPIEEMHPGVWRYRFGRPESLTPVTTRKYPPSAAISKLPESSRVPITNVSAEITRRGTIVTLPLEANEVLFGLGLQLQSFLQRGLKKKLRVNADPKIDSGDSHAPVPFYVTTNGYGVLIDTARYATIYCGKRKAGRIATAADAAPAANMLPAAYNRYRVNEPAQVLVEVPEAEGVDVYIFGGPSMRDAVARYNLFSGGGPLPPRWALGFWYRCFGQFNQEEVLQIASELRDSKIPCDVLGLEPGWQSHAYSCSFMWSDKFPKPEAMLRSLFGAHFRVNLWEHAFTHPTSPLYDRLLPFAGDYQVWDGLVPDFLIPEARRLFAAHHEREHVALGVSGYKLDECDNSDYTGNWSFPELSRFPSGADGEQMHCFFGLRYQDTIQSVFEQRKQRTFGLVRSSHALAAPYPYALYSDLYDHREFIRGVANAGFSGLLWCPEVRDAKNAEDLIRRLQTVVFSPLAMVNAWYIRNPPWKQVEQRANNAGQFAQDWKQLESACREIVNWRMRLAPYFYAAFVRYKDTGLPPFRALVMDYPDDPATWTIDSQYIAGESLLIAPVVAGEKERDVYLPAGEWFDFWTDEKHNGKQKLRVTPPLDRIPVYVKSGTLLPLADVGAHSEDPAAWRIHVRAYGSAPAPVLLIEDDGSLDPAFTRVEISWNTADPAGTIRRSGPAANPRYEFTGWERI